jgi:hypothetical protein
MKNSNTNSKSGARKENHKKKYQNDVKKIALEKVRR